MSENYVVRVRGKWVKLVPIIINDDEWYTDESRTCVAPTPNELADKLTERAADLAWTAAA